MKKHFFALMFLVLMSGDFQNSGSLLPLPSSCEELERLTKYNQEKHDENAVAKFRTAVVGFPTLFMNNFFVFERRFPTSIEELCKSPHVPVDCEELLHEWFHPELGEIRFPYIYPYQRRIFPGQPDVAKIFVRSGLTLLDDEVVKTYWDLKCNGGKLVWKMKEWVISHGYKAAVFVGPFARSDVPPAFKRAFAVQEFLRRISLSWSDAFEDRLLSFELLEEVFPVVKKLKNDYTGRYARPVNFPSPGDFQILPPSWERGSIRFVVFSDKGIPLLEDYEKHWVDWDFSLEQKKKFQEYHENKNIQGPIETRRFEKMP